MAIALSHLRGQSIGVLGLARSGTTTLQAARTGGASAIYAWDDRFEARNAAAADFNVAPTQEWPWETLDVVVMSPGIPLTHPTPHDVVRLAQDAGVEIVCDIELLYREFRERAQFVGVTGTNGKSTTTALIGHILEYAGRDVLIGGNIGAPVLDLDPAGDNAIFVLELSSYQLDLMVHFRPNVAVWLNLTPDHLDRHGGMEGYRRAKERIFVNMTPSDRLILGIDEPEMRSVAEAAAANRNGPEVVTVAVASAEVCPVQVDTRGQLIVDGNIVAQLGAFAGLRGRHNWQNSACALLACRSLGINDGIILEAMASFPGLAHRMEVLGQIGNVLFVNDSKATNADAAARSLATFDPVYWIAGGQPKEGGISELKPYFDRIAKAYLIGEAADEFSQELAGRVPHVIAGDLPTAVALAHADAALDNSAEPTVLLAPAAASFDQFKDFEARGDAFRMAVQHLANAPDAMEVV